MGEWFVSRNAWQVMAAGTAYFAVLYFVTALAALWLTRVALPRIGFGRTLDPRALPAGQYRREIAQACVSILIFGVGVVLPWGLLKVGLAHLAPDPSVLRFAIEVAALFLWNELHFYACHRLLHTRPLRRFHAEHHRSHIPTPFSTYAFHPVEALLLGSVPLVPMLLHDFSFEALLCLPVLSILLNGLAMPTTSSAVARPRAGCWAPAAAMPCTMRVTTATTVSYCRCSTGCRAPNSTAMRRRMADPGIDPSPRRTPHATPL